MNIRLRKLELSDIPEFCRHCIHQLQESAIGGRHAHPISFSHKWDQEQFMNNLQVRWTLGPQKPNGEIAWAAFQNEKIIGHLNLKAGYLESGMHRMRLGMGIEEPFRSKGIGGALLREALRWVKQENWVDWIDLSVFEHNTAAKSLYAKYGFKELYTINDAFRVDGEVINDVQMVLKTKDLDVKVIS